LKRSLTQKVQPVSPCPANALEALSNSAAQEQATAKTSSEGYRRVRHSAVLGLAAISMGATAGVLLPSQGDEAKAAEPNINGFPQPSETSGNPYEAAVKPARDLQPTQLVTLPQPLEVNAESSKGQLSQTYPIGSEAIAPSDDINASTPLSPSRKLNIPTSGLEQSSAVSLKTSAQKKAERDRELVKNQPKVSQKQIAQPQDYANRRLSELATSSHPSAGAEAAQPLTLAQEFSTPVENLQTTAVPENSEAARELSGSVVIPVQQPESPVTSVTSTAIAVPEPVTIASSPQPEWVTAEQPAVETLAEPRVLAPIAPSEKIYRIKPGDTLDAIALRYGVSRSDLTKANDIANPHQIQIDQELKIPQPQSVYARGDRYETIVPELTSIPQASPEQPAQFSAKTANANASESSNAVVVPTETQLALSSDSTRNWQPTLPAETTIVASTQEPVEDQQADYNTNPYVERLKADIERMRDEYRAQRRGEQQSQPEASLVERETQAVNPEWQTDRRSGSLTVRVEDRRQPLAAPQIQNLPQPQAPAQPIQVASTPVSPEQYNPLLRTVPGQTVEPQLPPLTPERYLPDSPAKFNGYMWPTKGVLTSGYGPRWGRMHKGIDIAGPVGTPIVAAAPGEVVSAGWNSGGYGNLVDIRHPDGSMTRYAHNSKILVRKGQQVQQGQQISLMGSTGYSTGPHLHFEVHLSGRGATNPMAYLPSR